MCSVSVVTVVFIHTMEDDQRLNTLVHEGDTLHFSIARRQFQPSDSVFSCAYVTLQMVKLASLSLQSRIVYYRILSWEKNLKRPVDCSEGEGL